MLENNLYLQCQLVTDPKICKSCFQNGITLHRWQSHGEVGKKGSLKKCDFQIFKGHKSFFTKSAKKLSNIQKIENVFITSTGSGGQTKKSLF